MKSVLTLLFLNICLTAACQQMNMLAGVEKTVTSTEYSAALLFENKSKWGLGAYYQTAFVAVGAEELEFKNPSYGLKLQVPLVKTEKLLFNLSVNAGLVNEKFVVVTPCLETRLNLFGSVGAVFGMGMRYGNPSASIKLIAKLF